MRRRRRSTGRRVMRGGRESHNPALLFTALAHLGQNDAWHKLWSGCMD